MNSGRGEYYPSVRIPDFVLKCIGYVCEVSHRDSSGTHGDPHATGFFVSVPCKHPLLQSTNSSVVYFVTAKHVAKDLANRDIYFRVNKKGGGTLAIEPQGTGVWWLHPNDKTADVAVTQIWSEPEADVISVNIDQLATPEMLAGLNIGIGDELYSTGLFAPVDATENSKIVPIVRHGNLAMMAGEPIQTELGYASVHLAEVRSLGGLSGSPVFVRPTYMARLGVPGGPVDILTGGHAVTLLGLMHGHWDIKESEMNKAYFVHDRKHGVNMGIAMVVPAIKILETINREELVTIRDEGERQWEKQFGRRMVPGMDSAKPHKEQNEEPFTQEDFNNALRKVSRKIEKGDSGSK